jgi:hypothetical protein
MIANLRPTLNHFCANVDLSVCPTKISGPLLGLGRRGGRLGPMSVGSPKIFSSNSKPCFLVPALAAYRPIALALLLPYRCAVPTLLPKAQAARTLLQCCYHLCPHVVLSGSLQTSSPARRPAGNHDQAQADGGQGLVLLIIHRPILSAKIKS